MFAVVAALLAGAFFFPYESDDDYYAKHQKKPPAKQADGKQQPDNPREVEAKGSAAEAQLALADLTGSHSNSGNPRQLIDPGAAAPIEEQIRLAEKQVASQNGGFGDDERLEGTWVQIFDAKEVTKAGGGPAPSTQPSVTTPANPATLTLHADGTFSEHLLLSVDDEPIAADRANFTGRYALQGYTLSVIRTDAAARQAATGTRKLDYVVCPLGTDSANGLPARLFVDGKVLKYQPAEKKQSAGAK